LTGKPYHEAKEDSTWSHETDDGSVEIDVRNIRSTEEPRFKSKVDEEIWRLKRKK
jgi:hypothetical protein